LTHLQKKITLNLFLSLYSNTLETRHVAVRGSCLPDHFIYLTMNFLHPFFPIIGAAYCPEQWGHVSGLNHKA